MVFTHGFDLNPFSTAFLASRAAPIITDGFEVFVHEVIEAITTSPLLTEVALPFTFTSILLLLVLSEKYEGEIFSYAVLASTNAIRSCGRFGPAIEGTIAVKSNSNFSENLGSAAGSCHKPFTRAYFSTSSNCSALRPVNFKYRMLSSSIGKIATVEPYSGDIFPIVTRLAIGRADTPGP